ncbi:P-loop containing nucleoside triphosphate hydrolase protein [Dacryopinax primogenitus]|uniref:p-loop containing nucleoside triphosphate hydrolase protein n=1 Tax=Dacryopinax primogenitus (strain DJM 731) TaxID=1858805 RepID=M5G014_DACPD|nr:P-loop containing nucleoside triphosphate hydrolase protein [Dacryopinax primogenitus]EJT99146.1 P-loop containing nucleoside triphosphate hydrolase protein [Dacryopinax primogenitus]
MLPLSIPRFPFPPSPPSWYAGHMAAFVNSLPKLLSTTSIVLEVRDARLPLTSVNPAFETALRRYWASAELEGKERIIIYAKRDLAERRYEEPLKTMFKKFANQRVMFANTGQRGDVRRVLDAITNIAENNKETHPRAEVLVVGMPNVGKSSLLNALRSSGIQKGKAFRTSATAGLTRKFTGHVKIHEEPDIYVSDTPGVMVPYLGRGEAGSEKGMKLAVTAGIKESLYDPELLASYLLHILPIKANMPFDLPHPYRGLLPEYGGSFANLVPPSHDQTPLLEALAQRLGRVRKGGFPNTNLAAIWLLDWFRKGGAGRWTSDFESAGGLKGVEETVRQWVEQGMGIIGEGESSQNQERRKKIEERRQKRLEKWKKTHGTRAVAAAA